MCGLIGIIDYSKQKFYQNDIDVFAGMMLLNSMRGAHSTGVFGVDKDTNKADVVKALGTPYHLLNQKGWTTFSDRIKNRYGAIIGHGRFATKGEITPKNAHPFYRGNITLVHNGTLTNFDSLKSNYKNGDDIFKVDSDICANLIHTFGFKDMLSKIRGAFAFIYHDNTTRKIMAIRNYERPLHMFRRTDRDQILLASDPAIFGWAVHKSDMKGKEEALDALWLYTIDMDTGEIEKEDMWYKHHSVMPTKSHNYYENIYEDEESDIQRWPFAVDTPPPKPATTVPSKSEVVQKYNKGDLELTLGMTIIWEPTDHAEPHTDPNTGAETTFVEGVMIANRGVEVTGLIHEPIQNIYECDKLEGTIHSIVVYPREHEFLVRAWVDKIKPYEPPKTNVVALPMPALVKAKPNQDADNYVETYDNTKVPKHLYEALAAELCCGTIAGSPCGTHIVLAQAANVLVIGNKIFCPDCVANGRYPKN